MSLPNGWSTVRLGEVCEVMDVDHKMPKSQQNGIPFISAKDLVRSSHINFAETKFISEEDYQRQAKKCNARKNDVLFSRIGTIGVARLVEDNRKFGISYSLCVVRPSKKVVPEYLEALMNSDVVKRQATMGTQSIAVPDLGLKQIKNFMIPLPPLDVQKKITRIYEKAKRLRDLRGQANKFENKVVQSVFLKMFGGNKYARELIRKHVVKTEVRDPRKQPDKPFKYVDIAGIDNKTGRISEVREILGKDAPSRARKVIRNGDVIVSTVRPNLNATALIPPSLDNQICSTGFSILRCKSSLNPRFLFAFTRRNEFINTLTSQMKGASYPAVTHDDVLDVEIPLPPIELQNNFSSFMLRMEIISERQKQSTGEIDQLFRSLTYKAFSGELVT